MSRCNSCGRYVDEKWEKYHKEKECKYYFDHITFFRSKKFWITEAILISASLFVYLTLFMW